MRRLVVGLAVVAVLVPCGMRAYGAHIVLDFNGTTSGFTDRMPGTGASLPSIDTDPNLTMTGSALKFTSTASTWFPPSGEISNPGISEAPAIIVPGVGNKDIVIQAGFRNVQLGDWADRLMLFAGSSINESVRAGLQMELLSQYGSPGLRQYLLDYQSDPSTAVPLFAYTNYIDTPGTVGLFANGDNIDVTLQRIGGIWSMSWIHWKTLSPAVVQESGDSRLLGGPTYPGSAALPWLNASDLYVGITYQDPRSYTTRTSYVDWLSVDVNDSAVPEPSTLIVWSLLGVCGMGIGWWRRKRAA